MGEVRRLLDLFATTIPEIRDIVECTSEDLEAGLRLNDSTLAFVRIPRGGDTNRLERWSARLGLFQHEEGGRWPSVAWDEIEVKNALAAWLRVSLRRAEHPLANLGIADLPIERLIAQTGEPIELLELFESAIEYATRQSGDGQRCDWDQCVHWAIARRLVNRIRNTDRVLRVSILERIAESLDGTLRPIVHPREVAELARVGLAHHGEGDALLVPLARVATEPRVLDILDVEGMREAPPQQGEVVRRTRATTVGEAVAAFEPSTRVLPSDPWFVDLREIVPEIREFDRRLGLLLDGGGERRTKVVILQHPGSGCTTMLRKILADRVARGLRTITVPMPMRAGRGFVDLLIAMLLAALQHADADPPSTLPDELLMGLRIWLADQVLDGELRDYVRLGAGIAERPHVASVIVLTRRLFDLAGTEGPERERVRLAVEARTGELLGHVRDVVASIRNERGFRICIHVESSEHLDAAVVDEVFVSHAADLDALHCDLVFSVSAAESFSGLVSETFSTLAFQEIPESSRTAAIRGLLEARADLEAIFEPVDAVVARMAAVTSEADGRLRQALQLASRACAKSSDGRVTPQLVAWTWLRLGLAAVEKAVQEAAQSPEFMARLLEALSPWIHVAGEDEFGYWASFRVGEIEQRMRLIVSDKPWTQGYWLAETPCTQALWQAVMGDNPSRFEGDLRRPVENVSWDDVQQFCARLEELVPGLNATLPTEGQWDYACRAGTDNLPPWHGTSGHAPEPVGQHPPNPWGLYDMLGNVWEWCADDLGEQPPTGRGRVMRGGGTRYVFDAGYRGDVGFRLARRR